MKRILSVLMTAVVLVSMLAIVAPAASAALYNSSSPIPKFTNIEVTDGAVRFTWDKITNSNCKNGVFYRVYYKNAAGSWTRMITTAATHFVDTDVHIGKTFTYTIRCVTPDGSAFASDFDHTGWKVTYYEAPVITSLSSVPETVAPTETSAPEETVVPAETVAPTEDVMPTEALAATGAAPPTEEIATTEADTADETVADTVVTEDIEAPEDADVEKTDDELAATGSGVMNDTVTWTDSGYGFRVICQYLDAPDEVHVVFDNTRSKKQTIRNEANGVPYAYRICALDQYGKVASAYASTPYYVDGTLYSTRNRWIYELLSAKISGFDDTAFEDYSYQELSDAAHTYGALTPAGYFNDGTSLTRKFTADTLCNLFQYKAHSLGNYYNTPGNNTVPFTKSSKANYYAADTTNKNMNTVGYYGWFEPDSKNKLYPSNNVTADEWDALMDELSLYRTWHGKTVISFGDSGMQGRGNVVNKNGGSSQNSWRDINRGDFANKRFPRFNQEKMEGPVEFVGEKYGMIHRDYSWSGASMGTELKKSGSNYAFTNDASYKSHVANQIRTAVKEKQKADLIIMNGGDNDEYFSSIPYSTVSGTRKVYDWGYSAPDWFSVAAHRVYHYNNPQYFHYNDKKVTEDYTKETSFVDGTTTAFSLLQKNYPSAPVIYVRSHQIEFGSLQRQRTYQEKVLSIAKSYGYKTVDLFNISDLDGFNKRIVAKYCYDGYYSNGTVDKRGIHPNALGYSKCYLPYIEDAMLTL